MEDVLSIEDFSIPSTGSNQDDYSAHFVAVFDGHGGKEASECAGRWMHACLEKRILALTRRRSTALHDAVRWSMRDAVFDVEERFMKMAMKSLCEAARRLWQHSR